MSSTFTCNVVEEWNTVEPFYMRSCWFWPQAVCRRCTTQPTQGDARNDKYGGGVVALMRLFWYWERAATTQIQAVDIGYAVALYINIK